jgi:hypothetical protein
MVLSSRVGALGRGRGHRPGGSSSKRTPGAGADASFGGTEDIAHRCRSRQFGRTSAPTVLHLVQSRRVWSFGGFRKRSRSGPSRHRLIAAQLGDGLMGLWMLSFGDRGAAIVEAESMSHARLRVAVKGLIRASLFIGGCQIDPEFIPLIPDETIGRKLSRGDANELLKRLKHAPAGRRAIGPPPQMLALPGPALAH